MCGRYSITTAPEALRRLFKVQGPLPNLPPRYNLAPTQDAPVVRRSKAGERELVMMRWGLVPYWSKGPGHGYTMINARAETVAAKPSFREALERRRCLVPADGFFEWRKAGRARLPYRITLANGEPFAFAGLWERWKSPAGERLDSFTIIVTDANAAVAPVHDRMPVILDPAGADLWLDGAPEQREEIVALLKPLDAAAVRLERVSQRVNSPGNDDPECLLPVDEDEGAGIDAAPPPAARPASAKSQPDERQLKLLD